MNGKSFSKPRFPEKGEQGIRCVELKPEFLTRQDYRNARDRETNRKRNVIDNLSYFMDREEWFEEKNHACIDLTTAKVIKGKIVLNGDVRTFLKLKKENAKRKIHDLFHAGKIRSEEGFHWIDEANGLLVPQSMTQEKFDALEKKEKEKVKNQLLYFHDPRFASLLAKEADEKFDLDGEKFCDTEHFKGMNRTQKAQHLIQQSLEWYLRELQELGKEREQDKSKDREERKSNLHTPTLEKLNRLRDSITANMIGVIFHLQKSYPGFVLLEDLGMKTIQKHFDEHNQNISRRLEWALFKKFQTLGQVPPHLKDVITLREQLRKESKEDNIEKKKKGIFQLGALIFVDKENTSKNCPRCEAKQEPKNKKRKKEFDEQKFEERRFVCGDNAPCGFDTKELNPEDCFYPIDDPDKVAAYNTAKRVQSPDDIRKIEETKKDEGSKKDSSSQSKKSSGKGGQNNPRTNGKRSSPR